MTTKDFLPHYLLDIMKDGTCFTIDKLRKTASAYTSMELKEALLALLKVGKVQNIGSHWRVNSHANASDTEISVAESAVEQEVPQKEKTVHQKPRLFVRCPNCSTALDIEIEYVGVKVECPLCNQVFVIADQKLSTNEYAVKSVKHKAVKDS